MRTTDVVELLAYIKSMSPAQRFEDDTPDAWHDALRSLELVECKAAVAVLAVQQRFIAPADIWREVREARRKASDSVAFGGGESWRRCPWRGCLCTHDGECVRGWFDTDSGVVPCPTCRPEVAQHLRMAGDGWTARQQLRTLPRQART